MEAIHNIKALSKIGLGGGCHWCTEAVFQSLKGVEKVEQGYVASIDEHSSFSEAVIVHFNAETISLKTLIEIHLHTHKSSSAHSMREKYRSAVYVFSSAQSKVASTLLADLQTEFDHTLITKVYPFATFKASREEIRDYYIKNPEKPFCERFINPKLKLILNNYSHQVKEDFIIST